VGWLEGVEHRVASGEGSQAGHTLLSDVPVVVEDLSTEKRFEGPSLLIEHGVVSGMSVVISGPGRPFGILGAHTRSKRSFTADDTHFLQALANVLASAIERKRNEESLAESEERFRQLAENVREVSYVNALEPLRVLYVSPAYETVWGRPCASLYADPYSPQDAIHPDDRARVQQHVGGLDTSAFDGEYRIVRPDGAIRWIRDRSSPVRDKSGRVYRIVGIAEDVTELRQAAEAQRRLVASEASLRARDEVLAIVAHDLRNPLSSIRLAANLLERPHLPPNQLQRSGRTIRRAVALADRLIKDLLDVARIEAGQLALEPAVLDIGSLVAQGLEQIADRAAEKSVALQQDIAADLPGAVGDPHRILQALGNLLGNAVKFTPPGGCITVRARGNADAVELSVEDTGAGIAAELLPHVFERFWRARPADRRGLGLGLAIVSGIVAAHQGRAWAQSEPGKGSIFHFTVPAARASLSAPLYRGPSQADPAAPTEER
jgi:PAS domain S-box-containing protein